MRPLKTLLVLGQVALVKRLHTLREACFTSSQGYW
jgi:hypothetical protein